MKKAILKIVILFLFCFTIKANLFCQIGYTNVSNNCIVEAKIIPGNDSIIANNSPAVTFMSASTNANSFKFIIDNIVYPINSIATVSFGVGITEVKLVAQNGNCTDTARCFYFNYGNYTNDTNNILLDYGIAGNINQKSIDFIKSRDSGFIIAGDRDHTSFANYLPPAGLIIKTTPRNCIKWSKIYTPIDNSQNNVISIDESYEDDIYVGLSQFPNSSFLIKNDKLGTELWTRKFINISGNDSIKISKIKALENGNILVLGKNDATNYYLRALLLDKNGNLLWQKKLNKNNSFFQHFISIVEKDEHVYICSSVGHTENNIFFSYGIITKINSQTGATLWSKYYKVNNGGRIYLNKISLIDNFIALSTTIPSMSTSHYNLCSIIFIDEDGFVKKSKELLFERRTTTSYVDIYQIKDKKYFLYIKGTEVIPNIANWNHSTIALLDSNFNTISVKNLFGERVLNFDKAIKYNDNSIALITTGLGYGLISGLPSFSKKIIINKIDTSNYFTTPLCPTLQINTPVQDISVMNEDFIWDIDNNNVDIECKDATTTRNYITANGNVHFRYECPSYIDSCSFLKLSGPTNVCDISINYMYKVHRNKACNQLINWNLPPNISMIQQTDSTITVKYNSIGTYTIAASIPIGCIPLNESIVIQVKSSAEVLDLGNDRIICKGDSIKLQAGNKFLSYKWQNGSNDSVLIANKEGLYWVEVSDSCSNVFRDSIIISFFPNQQVNVGSDRIKCNADTIHISATAGFKSYTWLPPYQINSTISQSVIVNPLIDTTYFLIAKNDNNCISKDTVNIKVHKSRQLNLGADTTICLNKDLTLKVPTSDFTNILWSNGSTEYFIKLKDSGLYWVVAKDNNKCLSTDSVKVALKECNWGFYIPNIFTPNNDNKNDFFKPIILGELVIFKFSIYNKYGQLVYNSQDYRLGWDGRFNNKNQNEGSYVWVCTYQIKNKQLISDKGSFILIR